MASPGTTIALGSGMILFPRERCRIRAAEETVAGEERSGEEWER
jgi:hypothetical protein